MWYIFLHVLCAASLCTSGTGDSASGDNSIAVIFLQDLSIKVHSPTHSLKGWPNMFSFCYFPPSWGQDEQIDPIILTVYAVTRRRNIWRRSYVFWKLSGQEERLRQWNSQGPRGESEPWVGGVDVGLQMPTEHQCFCCTSWTCCCHGEEDSTQTQGLTLSLWIK